MDGDVPPPSESPDSSSLDPESYTAYRLQHASPEHLHITSRRLFIGPIPAGWLKSNRRTWYLHHLHIDNYSSRAATFRTSENVTFRRQTTGLESSPSATVSYGHSFPQPDDVEEMILQPASNGTSEAEAPNRLPTTIPPTKLTETGVNGSQSGDVVFGTEGALPAISLEPELSFSPSAVRRSRPRTNFTGQSQSGSSFKTARETPLEGHEQSESGNVDVPKQDPARRDRLAIEDGGTETHPRNSGGGPLILSLSGTSERISSNFDGDRSASADASNSVASLLHRDDQQKQQTPEDGAQTRSTVLPSLPKGILSKAKRVLPQVSDDVADSSTVALKNDRVSSGLVRFNIPDKVVHHNHEVKLQLEQANRRRSIRRSKGDKARDGEILKMEKMLVRVETTEQSLPDDYDENGSLKVVTKLVEKWREFLVVCRDNLSEDADLSLQFYKTRVIPAVEQADVKGRSAHVIHLNRKTTHVNLYSALDKTVVVWTVAKSGTLIYIIRSRSSANSVEWYTFLRSSLGWHRDRELQVNVPDLNISLVLEDVFERVEVERSAAQSSEDGDDSAIVRTLVEEQAVARNVIERCMTLLEDCPEWSEVLNAWKERENMGLAWRRYDRLEWVHGANEQKMYGTIAMQNSHDLELRPKKHYPTDVELEGGCVMVEPAPVEGFLIRLTSQKGRQERFGKLFFKRLFFTTHNQFLCFCKPAKALPPPPPKLPTQGGSSIPSAEEIVDHIPLVYSVTPYGVTDGEPSWLKSDSVNVRRRHDQEAYQEAERRVNTLLCSDGYIDLCDVTDIRSVMRGIVPADRNVGEGDQVDFHTEVADTNRDDGEVRQFDDDRTFELVLKNGLVVRLQAYDSTTKKEWMDRLKSLVKYWKRRVVDDVELLKGVRRSNLELLRIDEEMESVLGQFGSKWEVSKSVASPELYNMCGISSCRAIAMAGVLYRKPRRHSTFTRCGVILCHGQLLIFQNSLRSLSGKELSQIHYEREQAIDLKECYIYSGLITENDLLYQNQTFDSNHPSRHALPRIYLRDGWTSSDEDSMTCFVVWQPRSKSLFRAVQKGKQGGWRMSLKRVSQLGVPGRSVVFKTRSRAERDHWVMNISMEIERLQQVEEVRVVSK